MVLRAQPRYKLISDRRDKLEPLDKWELDVVQQYHALMGHKALRAFYYLIYICIREARHCKTVLSSAVKAAAEVEEPAFDGWFSKTPGNGSENEISDRFMQAPPDMPFGAFCKAISIVFYTGGSQSWSAALVARSGALSRTVLCISLTGPIQPK